MKMLMLFMAVSLYAGAAEASWIPAWVKNKAYNTISRTLGFPTGDACGFTRLDGLHCIEKYVDRNGDGEIDNEEFEYAKQHYVPERVRRLEHLLKEIGWDYTLEKIMPACDADHDGRLTTKDWMASAKTCLPNKAALCKLQHICDIAAK